MSQTTGYDPEKATRPQKPSNMSTQPLNKSTSVLEILGKVARSVGGSVRNAYYWKKAIHYIDPNENSFPAPSSVLASATCFLTFCIFGGFATGFPNHRIMIAISGFGVLTFVGLVVLNARDWILRSK
jgi:hypothetical protein